ncbi:MAG: hypothetical protein DRR08_23625 [Candidatus Parabeggiatoa sp. nov. 2]|nr:MAG: hypothetical protein DRR08_23625 [Gammaproteobacteria bacterium]
MTAVVICFSALSAVKVFSADFDCINDNATSVLALITLANTEVLRTIAARKDFSSIKVKNTEAASNATILVNIVIRISLRLIDISAKAFILVISYQLSVISYQLSVFQ